METVATLNRISRERLSSLLLEQQNNPSSDSRIAIIDVRDGDYVGGHIRTSTHIPSTTLPDRTASLVRTLEPYHTVVFHCALSQQRGPSAALQYLRERRRRVPSSKAAQRSEDEEDVISKEAGEGVMVGEAGGEFMKLDASVEGEEKMVAGEVGGQEVFVLDGGFVKWQEKYGPDERLTEGWVKDIWEYGY